MNKKSNSQKEAVESVQKEGIKFISENIIIYNYIINSVDISLKIRGSIFNFNGYRNEENLVCINNPVDFFKKSGYKLVKENDSTYEIEKDNNKIKINKVSSKETKKLLKNIYLGEFCEKTEFDLKTVDGKTYNLFNLEFLKSSKLNWDNKSLETAFFIRKNLKYNFKIEFNCGLIGNISNEGKIGYFESSNYKTNPSVKPKYLKHMDNYHSYKEKASGKNIMELGIGIFEELDKSSSSKCQKYSNEHKFGFGCVQWPEPSRLKMIVDKYKELGNIKPKLEQCVQIETDYIKYEFQNIDSYIKIYESWERETLNLSPEDKVKIATKKICYGYEVPVDKEKKLPNREKYALYWFKKVEENIKW